MTDFKHNSPGQSQPDSEKAMAEEQSVEEKLTVEQSVVEQAVGEDATDGKVLVNGEELKKWPDNLFIPPDALEVFLETFQGPLDLLLYLIRRQNLDILDIPVAKITRQYMDYVEIMRKIHLDLAAEYLVMAAMLAEIKSRMLLPHPAAVDEEEGEDPRAALVRRLQEYERFNRAGQDIESLPRIDRDLYLVSASFEDPEPVKVESRASLNDLVVAFRNVVERSDLNQNFHIGADGLTVREKMTSILDRIRTRRFLNFEDLFSPEEGRLGLVVSFMAILELVRDDTLVIVQNEPFAPIHLKSID
jgi:segregation and condensation protein A